MSIVETIQYPAIIVVAYNRSVSLSRLLQSLQKAQYPSGNIHLIISIDYSGNDDVLNIAENFAWRHGKKEIIQHPQRLGLHQHVIQCGDLSNRFGDIIILEDDLYVSPCFYDYAVQALDYYQDDTDIAGISLYAHGFNEIAWHPFIPLLDGSDVFFMQYPSSWGQVWSKRQWNKFRFWYNKNKNEHQLIASLLPKDIAAWPDSSWKKFFTAYLIHTNLFFVYPRDSYTTNFGDAGTHIPLPLTAFQRPIQYASKKVTFQNKTDSNAVYDVFCEIMPYCLTCSAPFLERYNYEVDLYGVKPLKNISAEYLLTTKQSRSPVKSFSMGLKPHEANIIENIEGSDIVLSKAQDIMNQENSYRFNKKSLSFHHDLTRDHYDALKMICIKETDLSSHLKTKEIASLLLRTIFKRIRQTLKS